MVPDGVDALLPIVSLQGVVSLDFANNAWANSSSTSTPSQSGYFVQSQAVFVPNFGSAGLIAVLGGDTPSNQTYQYEAGAALSDFTTITFYDPASGNWYYQTATGSIPAPRSEFCMVGIPSLDNNSYELFVYGGSTNSTYDEASASDVDFQDVFILSIPSFTWFQSDATAAGTRRSNHFCQIIGHRQMLVIGGRNPSFVGDDWSQSPDSWTKGMDMFDMSALSWTSAYDANAAEYDSPAIVKEAYANGNGNVTWSSPVLEQIFVTNATKSTNPSISHPGSNSTSPGTSPPATNSTCPNTSPTTSRNSSSSSSDIATIVGGVVCGVLVLLAIAVIALLCVRRRRRQQSIQKIPQAELPYTGSATYEAEGDRPAKELPGAPVSPKRGQFIAELPGDERVKQQGDYR